jgi:hypothetical protein
VSVTIYEDSFSGGSGVTPYDGEPNLAAALRVAVDDLTEIRTQFIALLTKMDVDFTAQNLAVASSQLDENYVSTLTPAALTLIKG